MEGFLPSGTARWRGAVGCSAAALCLVLAAGCGGSSGAADAPGSAAPAGTPTWDTLPAGTLVAHRGGADLAPENTLQAFREAVRRGLPFELDVHVLADGGLAVIHDDTLDRTTEASGPVAALTTQEFRALGLPTLDDVLREFGNRALFAVHNKVTGQVGRVLSKLDEYGVHPDTVVIKSFDRADLLTVEEAGWATMFMGRKNAQHVAGDGGDWLAPELDQLTPEVVAAAHSYGMRVVAWTVDGISSPEEVTLARSLGADVIMSDRPW